MWKVVSESTVERDANDSEQGGGSFAEVLTFDRIPKIRDTSASLHPDSNIVSAYCDDVASISIINFDSDACLSPRILLPINPRRQRGVPCFHRNYHL